jgi:hypothetical protein
MKGKSMEEFRLVQVFLSESMTPGPAIFEVSMTKDAQLQCTCPGFSGRKMCKHIKFVRARVEGNHGTYPLEISSKATKKEAEFAQKSPSDFRSFVIKYGKVEVC